MPRSLDAEQQAFTAPDRDPTPPVPLTTRQREHYRGVLRSLPPTAPLTVPVLALAASLAISYDEVERCNETLDRLKRLIVKGKPHPLLAVRHAAQLRIASLSSRLRLLPTLDQREVARAARYNARHGGPLDLPEAPADDRVRRADGSVDWQATAAKRGTVQ